MRLDARTELWLSERLSDSDSDSDGNATGGSRCGLVDMRFDGAPSSTERSTECPSSVDSDTRGGGSCIVLPSLRSDVDNECRACEVAVGSLESVLGDPMVKENIFEKVIKICDQMTGRSRMICTDVISQLLPEVQGIVFDIPAWFVCTKLKMCPYGQYLDTSACSNPRLWCQDKETAFLCNRLNFCRLNAWSSSKP